MSSFERNYHEKRDFIRMKVNTQLNIAFQGSDYPGTCVDLSGTGMSIETTQAFAMGDVLDISIDQKGDHRRSFHASAEVARLRQDEAGNYILGLLFIDIKA